MYTMRRIFNSYDHDRKDIYKNKVTEYEKENIKLFLDSDTPEGVAVVKEDVSIMRSILENLSNNNIDGALDAATYFETLPREDFVNIMLTVSHCNVIV